MDEDDRMDTIDILQQSDEWVIWKSKDKWSDTLKITGFHQLLYINKDDQEVCLGSKIKGWWRTGDIRVKKPKKTYECWVKNKTKVPLGSHDVIITTLQVHNHNFDKDECGRHDRTRNTLLSGNRIGPPRSVRIQGSMHLRRRIL
jgi:hypothetical protein